MYNCIMNYDYDLSLDLSFHYVNLYKQTPTKDLE